MKILEAMTEHTAPFKLIIEVLKELLPETNMEFIMGDETDKKDNETEQEEEQQEEEQEEEKNTEKESDKKKGGMKIMAMDTTKNVLIHLKLDAENFTKFKCKRKKLVLGVNLAYFHKLIKTMDKDDNLTMYVDHDNLNYLRIKIDNPEVKKDTEFELKLLDLPDNKLVIPDTVFDAVITINATEFHRICREMNQIASHVEIKCYNNKVVFGCKGEYAKRTTTYKTGENSVEGVNIKLASTGKNAAPIIIQGIYDLKNLVMFSKCGSLCNEIEIFMKNDYPIVIKYTVATLGRLLLCLVPITKKTGKDVTDADVDDDEYYSDEEVQLIST
jgi:proliferating cell nuclear antigen